MSSSYGAKTDLSRTSFGTKPTDGMEVVDAYADDVYKAFSTPDVSKTKSISESYPGVKPNLVNGVKSDPDSVGFIKKNNYSNTNAALKALADVLPTAVSVNDVLEKFTLSTALGTATNLSKGEPRSQYNTRYDKQSYIEAMTKSLSADKEFNNQGALKKTQSLIEATGIANWFPADAYGGGTAVNGILGTGDYITAVVKKYGLAQKFIDSGAASGLVAWLAKDDFLPPEVKKWLMANLAGSLGMAGLWDELDQAITIAANRFTPVERTETIRGILTGFTYDDGIKNSDKPALATDLITHLDAIDPQWDKRKRNSVNTEDLRNIGYASVDCIDVFFYNTRTAALAATYKAFRPYMRSYKAVAQENYPYLYLG